MSELSVARLQAARTVVIKFGSNIIKDATPEWFDALAADIKALKKMGKKIVIVTSGAIALARKELQIDKGKLELPFKQAAAMVGQPLLMNKYSSALNNYGLFAGQGLLTNLDINNPLSRENAIKALQALMAMNGIPIINENDVIATQEISFGDNDGLAAQLAEMIKADALILFSTINGFAKQDPLINPDAPIYEFIDKIELEHRQLAGDAPEGASTGGMKSKLRAANSCMKAHTSMIITNGIKPHALRNIFEDASKPCTLFVHQANDNIVPGSAPEELALQRA